MCTTSKRDRAGGGGGQREGNWLICCRRRFQRGKGSLDAAGVGRWRSTTPRTTRTCVCKTLTRVHALARRRALAHTSAPARLIKRSESSIRVGRVLTGSTDRERCTSIKWNVSDANFQPQNKRVMFLYSDVEIFLENLLTLCRINIYIKSDIKKIYNIHLYIFLLR